MAANFHRKSFGHGQNVIFVQIIALCNSFWLVGGEGGGAEESLKSSWVRLFD